MKLKLYEKGTIAEVVLSGRLDSNTSPEVEKALVPLTEKYTKLTLNLKELEYISSAGLRVIKVLYMAMTKKGGKIAIKNVSQQIMEIFEMTGFAGLLSFE